MQSSRITIHPARIVFATSVWINDKFISTTSGGQETNALYTFPEGSVKKGEDNVITVVQDNMGNDEDPTGMSHNVALHHESKPNQINTEKSPRGITGFQLKDGNFSTWKVQGKVGGYLGCVSPNTSH